MSPHLESAVFRGAAARFLTGVTVTASLSADGTPVGMTVNSFTTVSARPPTVLVSLRRGRTWQAVTQSGAYTVNVLPADAVAIGRHFGGKGRTEDVPDFTELDGFPVLPGAIAHF